MVLCNNAVAPEVEKLITMTKEESGVGVDA